MAWRCKLCATVFDKRAQLLEHYRLHHSNFSSVSPLPCLYDDCVCTFHSVNALKIHLTRLHTQTVVQSDNQVECVSFVCAVCKFKEPFNDKTLLSHLRTHLKQHEMVDCPFKHCNYRTNVYSSFNAHKSRNHLECEVTDFKTEIVLRDTDRQPIQEVIGDEPPVGEILERWPALKMESQICAEFHRISNINLKNYFYAELDRHAPRLQSLFRKKAARTGKVAEVLSQIFRIYDLQEHVDVHLRRAAVLRALPAYLHEDDSGFLKQWDEAQSGEPNVDDIPVGLLFISANSTDATFFCPERVAVVLEGNIVIDFPTFTDAFVMLFALIYALHLSYPKALANTFDFMQKVLMGLEDGKLKPRVLSLKNDLLVVE